MAVDDLDWWTRVLAGPGGSLSATGSDERYLLLPRRSDPRVVVDCASAPAARDVLVRFASTRTSNTSLHRVVGAGSALVRRTRSAWSVEAAAGGTTLRDHLSDVLGRQVQLSIAVGPPRPNRKPVVRCYQNDRIVAVAKLGPDSHTSAMVENEARWLERLADDPLDDVRTPQLIHSGRFGDMALVVMGAMDLRSDLGVTFDDVPSGVTKQLVERHRNEMSLAASPWWTDLPGRLREEGLAPARELLGALRQDSRLDDVDCSAWHGDWSPWNMGRSSTGALYVWDWERAAVGVPAGLDLLHLHYQYGGGLDAADSSLQDLGVPVEHHHLLKCVYLLEVCARHADAQSLATPRHTSVMAELTRLQRSAGAR